MNMRRFFVRAFWVSLLLLLCTLPLAAQGNVIEITPSVGQAGSTVVIRDLGGNRGKNCFMVFNDQATPIGTMAGSITYIIPTFVQPGSVLEFLCAGGQDGRRSNTVTFTAIVTFSAIIPSPTPAILTLSDSDGDGIVDVSDACPTVAGIPEQNGCPPDPGDSDGDGIFNPADACPSVAGVPEQNGCPLTISPEPVDPQPPVVIDPPPSLPDLPTTGACVLATIDADMVNIRQGTSTDTPIVGQISPLQIYTVIGRNADSSWFQIEGGWVAGFVTRRGGDCSAVVDGTSNTIMVAEVVPSGLLVPAVQEVGDLAAELQNCPNLAPAVNALPNFLTLYILGEPDPCAAAQAELDGLFLTGAQQPLFDEDPFESCHALLDFDFHLYHFYDFMDRLQNYAPATWQAVYDTLPENTYCSYIYDLIKDGLLPEEIPNEHVAPFVIAYCMFGDMTQGWFNKTVGFMNFIGFRRDSLELLDSGEVGEDDTCNMVGFIRTVGTILPANVELYQFLHNVCLWHPAHASLESIYEPIREALDASVQLNNCGGTGDSQPLPAYLQSMLPSIATNDYCIGNFRLLATYNQTLGMEMLYRMLVSPDACELAWEYSRDGYVAQISGLAAPECIQGDEVVLTQTALQQVVINQQSPWRHKLMVLDRPFNQVCDWIDLPGVDDPDFAPNPVSILGSDDIAIAPSATPLGFVIAPSATPLGLALVITPVPPVDQPPDGEPPAEEPPAEEPPAEEPPGNDQQPDAPQPLPNPEQPSDVPSGDAPASDPASAGQGTGADETITIDGNRTETIDPDEETGALALYVGTNAQGEAGVYLLTNVAHSATDTSLARYPLHFHLSRLDNYPVSLSPDGQYAVYFTPRRGIPAQQTRQISIMVDPNAAPSGPTPELEEISLVYHSINWAPLPDGGFTTASSLDQSVVLNFPIGLTPAPYSPLTMPETGDQVLVFFLGGVPNLYQVDLNVAGDVALAQLLVENAAAPAVSPNGRYIAFERADAGGRNLYVMSTNSRAVHPITQQQGSECYAPQFGSDSLTLFFTCEANGERKIFRYSTAGVTELALGIPNAGNPMPSETPGFITFDDGQKIYIAREDGSQVATLLNFDFDGLSLSRMMWVQSLGDGTAQPRFYGGIVNRISSG